MLFSVPVTVIGFLLALSIISYSVLLQVRRHSPYLTEEVGAKSYKLLVSLGSGGHTTEMFYLLQPLQMDQFTHRYYYISSGDSLSRQKALDFEKDKECGGVCTIRTVSRARRVKQSWLTTPLSVILSCLDAIRFVWHDRPDLVICNGPGTCVVIVLASLLLRYTGVKSSRVIFVESFARVESLSLSGRILIGLVDRFLVMWPDLAKRYEKAEYAGFLL